MENNVTQHMRIVGPEQAGVHPQVGYYLVLLKQAAEGRILYSVLQPGQRPPEPGVLRRLFRQDSTLVSIPVNANTSLRHEFTDAIQHVSPGHSFEADYVMGFAIGSPEKVAIRWIEDPVRRVEEEVKRVLNPQLRVTDWKNLKANILADGAARLFQNVVHNGLNDIRPLAEEYGIDLRWLRVVVRLSRTEEQPDADAADLHRKQLIEDIKSKGRQAEVSGEHQVKMLEARNEAELLAQMGPTRMRGAIVDGMVKATDNVATNTLQIEDAERIFRRFPGLMGGQPGKGAASIGGADIGLLNPAPSGPATKAATQIMEVAEIIESLAGSEERRRDLFSSLTHLIAEAYRSANYDPGQANGHTEYLKQAEDLIAADWGGSLTSSQYMALNRFKNFAALQEQFK
jgi:hypothetical protein